MARRIRIKAGELELQAELNDTRTADAIWEALPIQARGNRWGDEIYFRTPIKMGLEEGKEVVGMGDLGYWPPGQAFCIFFGPTPASRGDEIRPASPVTIVGRLLGDPTVLKGVRSGTSVTLERIEA
jgi:hypothetical protein